MNRAELTETLLRRMGERGIAYCVLRNYDHLPDPVGHDLDIAVRKEDLPAVESLICETGRRDGIVAVRHLGRRYFHQWTLCNTKHDAESLVQIDLVAEPCGWGGFTYLPTGTVLKESIARGGYPTPRPAHEACISILWALMNHGKVLRKYVVRAAQLAEEDHPTFRKVLENAFGYELADRFVGHVLSKQPDDIDAMRKPLMRAMVRRALARDGVTPLRRFAVRAIQKAGVLYPYSRLSLAFIGPDGVGKSTTITALAKAFEYEYNGGIAYCHWRPGLLKPMKGHVPRIPGVHKHHHPVPGLLGRAISLARLPANVLLCHLGYLARVVPAQIKRKLVCLDRYCYAYVLFPESVRYFGPTVLADWAVRMMPRPDLTLALSAPPAAIHERKPELTTNEISEQLQRIERLTDSHKRIVSIDASGTAEQTIERSIRATTRHLAKRTARRLAARHGYRVLRTGGVERLALAADNRRVWSAALELTSPTRWSARAALRATQCAPRIAVRLTTRSNLEPGNRLGQWDWRGWLADVRDRLGDEQLSVAFSFPRDPDQHKTAVLLARPDGSVAGFGKVALDELYRPELHREAEAMRSINQLDLQTINAPSVLAEGQFDGCDYVVCSAVPASAHAAPRRWSSVYENAWRELRDKTTFRGPLDSAAWWSSVPRTQSVWSRIADRLESSQPREGYEFCTAHGDWAPWNARCDHDVLWLYDWELFSVHAPCCLDPLHFTVKVEGHVRSRPWAMVARSMMDFVHASGRSANPSRDCSLALVFMNYLKVSSGGRWFGATDLDTIAHHLPEA